MITFDRGCCSFTIQWLQIEICIGVAWQCVFLLLWAVKKEIIPNTVSFDSKKHCSGKRKKNLHEILEKSVNSLHTESHGGWGVNNPYTQFVQCQWNIRKPILGSEHLHLPLQKDDFCCWSVRIVEVFLYSYSLRKRYINWLIGSRAACQTVIVGFPRHSRRASLFLCA